MPWYVNPEKSADPFYVADEKVPEFLTTPEAADCVKVEDPKPLPMREGFATGKKIFLDRHLNPNGHP